MKQALILVYNFFKNPDPSPVCQQTIGSKIKWLFFLLVFEMPFVFIAWQMQQFLFRNGLVSSEGHFVEQFMQEINPWLIVALMILLIPFIEELMFRLPLRFKRAYFIPFIIIGISFMGYTFLKMAEIPLLIAILISILATVVIFVALYNQRISERLEHAWSSNYRAVFYTVASLFALYHLTNFKFSLSLLLFAPIVVLPQFIGGLLSFMGKNDTLKFVGTNSNFLTKTMGIAFDMKVKNNVDTDVVFSVEIPNDDFSSLNAYLKSKYGLKIEKKTAKEKALIIY